MVVTRQPPLLPHPLASRLATTVSPSISIQASRFFLISYYPIHAFERCTSRCDRCSQCGEIQIIADGGVSEQYCQYLRTGCTDLANCFFYIFSMFPFTTSHSFMSVASAVIIQRPPLSPHPLSCPMMAHTLYLPQPQAMPLAFQGSITS